VRKQHEKFANCDFLVRGALAFTWLSHSHQHMLPLIQRRASPPPVEAGFAPAGARATNPIPFATRETRVRLLEERPETPCVYHVFPVRVADRARMAAHLQARGIETGVHYPLPLHRQPSLRALAVAPNELRCAEAWAREELALPMSPKLEPAEVVAVANGVLERV
jgi:hypothetical protein